MLDKLEKFNVRLSNWFEWLGLAAMLLIMVVTCVDVVAAKVFKAPILGALDMVMLCQIVAISFAGSITLIAGRHIRVEFFFDTLSHSVKAVIAPLIHLLGMGLFILIIWHLVKLGNSFQESGEYSATAYIPLFPFAYGAAFASLPICLKLMTLFIKSLTRNT